MRSLLLCRKFLYSEVVLRASQWYALQVSERTLTAQVVLPTELVWIVLKFVGERLLARVQV